MTRRLMRLSALLGLAILATVPTHVRAQLSETSAFLARLSNEYRVLSNVTYHVASGHENRLDLYVPRNAAGPTPVVMYIHGGGWVGGAKETNVLRILPYLEMGWAVANIEYRLGAVARAPAAVEDGLCALRWVVRNAEQYNLDPSRVVTTGNSAGGHLALTTGTIPASAGLDRECPGSDELSVAAIVNWYGITDVGDLLEGPNLKSYAVQWLGSQEDRFDIAERVSPMTYVRSDLPPVLTIHGDADPVVPYQHAVLLHEALDRAGVPNALYTVPGGGHGGFSGEHMVAIFETVRDFLREHGVGDAAMTSQAR